MQALVERARSIRKHPPRIVWILALLLGAVCLVGFIRILTTEPNPAGPSPASKRTSAAPVAPIAPVATVARAPYGPTFTTGLIVGVAAGAALGYFATRHSARKTP